MVRVRGGVVIPQVAGDAGLAVQGVVAIGVAIRTLPRRHCVHARQSESGGGVVELAIRPLHRVVALLACRGETCVRHRASRLVVVVLVATDARRSGDAVVIVDVAIGALPWWDCVRSGQRETGLRVIKRRRLPCRSVVAKIASLRKPIRDMIRIRCALEIF